jgi:hypothetical protein
LWVGAQVHVIDEVAGAVTCFSDGTNWRRITDSVIASAVLPTAISSTGATAVALNAVVGPYPIFTGVGTATFSGANFVEAAVSATGAGAVSLDALGGIATSAFNITGAATANFVGALGEGELAGMNARGTGTATFETLVIGEPAAMSATGANISLFDGVAA